MFEVCCELITVMSVNSTVQFITVFIIFIVVLALTYFTTRFVGGFQKNRMTSGNITIVEAMRLSNNKLIEIVKVGDKYYAIAVCKDTVTLLGEVEGDSLDFSAESKDVISESFSSILDKLRHKE